ncbi:hypothetical protein GCM10009764_39820 [Nocardia ninae]|uniref:Integral membrane protein n=1 Tax=Nocardia ninae NBRC 108245 TaxID=1210091 RepID=A0A511MJ58_9NOCA|nr:hypothetical protein NN4_46770 [Nocardia ninae NBRC 108245]
MVAVCLYQYIDVFGLYPGSIAMRRSKTGRIGKVYYLLYNILHSAVTQGIVVISLWLIFGWHWEYLAIPIHLCADRGLLNNYPKPFFFPWNPETLPEFERLLGRNLESGKADIAAAVSSSKPGT